MLGRVWGVEVLRLVGELGRACGVVALLRLLGVLGRVCGVAVLRLLGALGRAVEVLRSERLLGACCCIDCLGRSLPPPDGLRPCADAGAARANIATESATLDNV